MKLDKTVLDIKKGQALIGSANLRHGGEKITLAGSTRYTRVNHFYFENCACYRPMKAGMDLERISIRKVNDMGTGEVIRSNYPGTPINDVGYAYKMYLPDSLLRRILPVKFRQWVQRIVNK